MLSLLTFIACKAIVAPEDFDNLTSYLYQHLPDDNPALVEAGMENMLTWAEENVESLEEGYYVSQLSMDAIHTVHPDLAELNLMGAALSIDIQHDVDTVARLLFLQGPSDEEPAPDAESYHVRVYNEDPQCFIDRECEMLSWTSQVLSEMPLSIVIETQYIGQVRWVETSYGPALLKRRWFITDPVVSVNWADLKAEYALKLSLPMADGVGSRRIEVNWIDIRLGDIPISEDLGLLLGLKAIRDHINSLNNKVLEPENAG